MWNTSVSVAVWCSACPEWVSFCLPRVREPSACTGWVNFWDLLPGQLDPCESQESGARSWCPGYFYLTGCHAPLSLGPKLALAVLIHLGTSYSIFKAQFSHLFLRETFSDFLGHFALWSCSNNCEKRVWGVLGSSLLGGSVMGVFWAFMLANL